MVWMDTIETIGWIGLTLGMIALAVWSWRESRRDARGTAAVHAERYTRFLRFLSDVRDARR